MGGDRRRLEGPGLRRWTALDAMGAVCLVAAIALMTTSLMTAISSVTYWPGPFVDWRTYENALARLLAGGGIYSPEQLVGPYQLTSVLLVGYAYPPASVILMLPFQGYPFGLAAWVTLNLGALMTALWTIVSRAWPSFRLLAFAGVVASLALFTPFVHGMIAASTNIGIAGAIGWVSVGLGPRRAGAIGGLLVVVKVFAGAVTIGTSHGKLRAAATGALVVAGLVLITMPIVGVESWWDFRTALLGAVPDCSGFNMSIACAAGPTLGFVWSSILGVAVGGLATLAMMVIRQPFALGVLAAVAVMAPANNLHIHYWTIGYVLMVAALARLTSLRRVAALATTTSTA